MHAQALLVQSDRNQRVIHVYSTKLIAPTHLWDGKHVGGVKSIAQSVVETIRHSMRKILCSFCSQHGNLSKEVSESALFTNKLDFFSVDYSRVWTPLTKKMQDFFVCCINETIETSILHMVSKLSSSISPWLHAVLKVFSYFGTSSSSKVFYFRALNTFALIEAWNYMVTFTFTTRATDSVKKIHNIKSFNWKLRQNWRDACYL